MRFAQPSYETFARPCIAPYLPPNHQFSNLYDGGSLVYSSDLAQCENIHSWDKARKLSLSFSKYLVKLKLMGHM